LIGPAQYTGCPNAAGSAASVATETARTVLPLEAAADDGAAADDAPDLGEDDPEVAATITPATIAATTSATNVSTIG
jgi:hypothetical protein